ncbi:MAG: APC family permease [Nitrososphaerota archaeon]|nr:APC family permease [Nitrososphaerota archaeon]
MTSKASTGFARQATGLAKNVSLFDAIALNVSYMSTGAALSLIGFTVILLPSVSGVNLVYASLIGFLISIPQVVVYSMMSRRASRTGGDYVWMSRSLGGLPGSAITFMGMTMETMPYLALIALSAVFAIGSVGVAMGDNGLLGLALPGNVTGSDPASQVVVAGSIFTALILLNIVRPRLGFKLISALMVIGLLALVVAVGTIFSAGQAGIAGYIDGLGIAGVTYSSLAGSYTGSSFDVGATLSVLPFFAIFVYPWFNASASVGSELKGKGAISWNAPISAVLAFLVVTIPLATMYYVGGLPFTNSALYNQSLVVDNSFNFWTLAMGVTQSMVLKSFIGAGWILWEVAILAFGIITISRYLLAQSFDRFLPARFAYVSERWNSPVFAHLFDLVVTVSLIALAAFVYGTISSLYGAVLAAMVYFLFVGVGAAVYGLRRERGSARVVLAVAGSLMGAAFLYLTYEFLAAPGVWGGNELAYGYIVTTFVGGVVIYLASKAYHGRRGLDLSLLFKEIPPE